MPDALRSVASPACHVCGEGPLEEIPGLGALATVSSDCRPAPWRGEIHLCPACGTVQKLIDENWRLAAAAIYDEYALYHQSRGAEQPTFQDGNANPRSEAFLRWALAAASFPASGLLADVGCGNGGFLRSLSKLRPGWRLRGLEWGERHREVVSSIPGVECFDPSGLDGLSGIHDAVAMVHVLEHIPGPVRALALVRERLALGGVLLALVPDHSSNPFDLIIADHCTHFTPLTLERSLAQAGFGIVAMDAGKAIPKEIAVLARRAHPTPGPLPDIASSRRDAESALGFLGRMLALAGETTSRGPAGIFGTSIGGVWLASHLGDKAGFFVDEDQTRVGRSLMGLPVLSPKQVPRGARVLLPLAPAVAQAVRTRLESRAPGVRWLA